MLSQTYSVNVYPLAGRSNSPRHIKLEGDLKDAESLAKVLATKDVYLVTIWQASERLSQWSEGQRI